MAIEPGDSDDRLHLSGQFVADHISAILSYWDKDQICRFANAAYVDWFGKTPDEMVDRITLRELLGEELYEKSEIYITAALDGKVQTFERDIPVPSGEIKYSFANYVPDIVNGEVRGIFVHVADITPIKLLEMQLIRSNDIISEQNNRLLNFTGIVSHNLRSYANNLRSIVDLLVTTESETERNELLNYLKGISTEFSSTVSHLNEVVAVQNLNTNKAERINIHEYILKSVSALGIQIKSSNARIINNVGPEMSVMGNPAYMESIILNFLTNAIKYRHPGRELIVEVDTVIRDKELILSIADNGLGINLKKYGNQLFGMYKTFHGNPDARGVGLFMTKIQVESMGGRIDVKSEEGKGTTFSIYFKL